MLIKLMRNVRQFQTQSFGKIQPLFEALSKGQHPDILLITCIDSRVIPNLLTQSKPGELLIHRNPGNIVPAYPNQSSEAATVEYALKVLHIKDIIICGHSDCGAVKGLLTPALKNQLPSVSSWVNHSHSVLNETDTYKDEASLQKAIEKNVLAQLEHLKTYPLVAEHIASNQLTLHGWVYHFETGEVLLYEQKQNRFIPLQEALQLAIEERRNKIVSSIATNYLEQLAQPQTAEDYRLLRPMLSQIKENLIPIWSAIKEEVAQSLWTELGEFYTNPMDSEFTALLEQGVHVQLKNLKGFQQKIKQSSGYHQYWEQSIHPTFFGTSTERIGQDTVCLSFDLKA